LPSGQPVVNFGMATSNFYTDKSGQKQQQTEFHNVVFFGRLADIASQYLNKGSLALVEGRLQTRTWEDSTGNKKTRTEIIGQNLQLGPRSSGGGVISQSSSFTKSKKTIIQSDAEDIPVINEEDNENNFSSFVDNDDEEEEIDVKNIPL